MIKLETSGYCSRSKTKITKNINTFSVSLNKESSCRRIVACCSLVLDSLLVDSRYINNSTEKDLKGSCPLSKGSWTIETNVFRRSERKKCNITLFKY